METGSEEVAARRTTHVETFPPHAINTGENALKQASVTLLAILVASTAVAQQLDFAHLKERLLAQKQALNLSDKP